VEKWLFGRPADSLSVADRTAVASPLARYIGLSFEVGERISCLMDLISRVSAWRLSAGVTGHIIDWIFR
jgi:hypothetical protein